MIDIRPKKCVIKLLLFVLTVAASDWFVTNKKLEKLDDVVFSFDDVDLHDIGSDNVIFVSDDIGLKTIYLNNINLDDDNFDDYDRETIIHDLWLGVIDTNNACHVKKV